MKILVTGAAGFIGFHLAAALAKNQKSELISAKPSGPGPQSGPNRGSIKEAGPSSKPVIDNSPIITSAIKQEPTILMRNESNASSMQNDVRPSAVAK